MNLYLFTSGLALEENRVVIFSPSLVVFIENVKFLLLSNNAANILA